MTALAAQVGRYSRLPERARASAAHFVFSATLAAACAALVYLLWYPAPLGSMSGVSDLFVLMLGVDVVLVQLGALGYGMWTVFAGRPVHGVFEYDRIRVVHANEVPEEFMDRVPPGMDALPLIGPTLLALRPFKDNSEQTSAILTALGGVQMSARPELWMDYQKATPEILKAAKPVAALMAAQPAFAVPLQQVLADHHRSIDNTVYLPLASRAGFGTALLDATTAQPVALLPLDSF